MESKIKAFYVEDNELWRNNLKETFSTLNVELEVIEGVPQAREWIKNEFRNVSPDVAILDMDLGNRQPTGAELGKEIVEYMGKKPCPEFLIFSSFDKDPVYLKQALDLGAAAYLSKENVSRASIVSHVRALALRRRLHVGNDLLDKIEKIVRASRDRPDAISRFCAQVIQPEIETCLDEKFVLLLKDEKKSYFFSNMTSPINPLICDTIRTYLLSRLGIEEPVVLSGKTLNSFDPSIPSQEWMPFEGACGITMSAEKDITLSLLLLDSKRGRQSSNMLEFSKILSYYFRGTMLSVILNIVSRFAALDAERKTVLKATSRFCMHIGQEQASLLQRAIEHDEVNPENATIRKMRHLAESLRDTGDLLEAIQSDQPCENKEENARVSARSLLESSWKEIPQQPGVSLKLREGDFSIVCAHIPHYLDIAFSCIFKWMIDRCLDFSTSSEATIEVRFTNSGIIWEDSSRRLPEVLRQYLFEPFSSLALSLPADLGKEKEVIRYTPLYLARMIVEIRNQGRLEDRTHELEKADGHRFVVSF